MFFSPAEQAVCLMAKKYKKKAKQVEVKQKEEDQEEEIDVEGDSEHDQHFKHLNKKDKFIMLKFMEKIEE